MGIDGRLFNINDLHCINDLQWAGRRLIRKGMVVALPVSAHLALGALRGFACGLLTEPRDSVRRNIEGAVLEDHDTAERIVRDYHAFSKRTYLWRILPRHPGFKRSKYFPVIGLEHLQGAMARERGVILVTAHLGYPHIIPRVLERHGYTVRQLLAELDRLSRNRHLEEYLKQASKLRRAIYQNTKVATDKLYESDMVASLDVRPLLSALKNNEIVMIAGDGLRSTQFINFPLFGKPYPFPTGFIKLALTTGAAVLPAFAVPDRATIGIRVEIHSPLRMDRSESLESNVRQFADALDGQLRKTPHLWLRWRIPNWFEVALNRGGRVDF